MTEKSPFESMTPESIKSEMLGRVINAGVDVDAREGSYANILLSEAAYVMWKYGQTLNGFIDILFPGAQSGRYLDLHAAQIGMTRQPGAKAKVTVTFSGVNGTKIPAGTVVCTPSALRFLTTEEVTIADGLASVLCVAEDIGADYNVPEATVTQMAVNIHGVHGVTNAAAGVGGADEESDADLWARYHERRTEPITSGNANHYVMWAKEVTGVSYARCITLWNGNGTVKVIIAGADKKPLDDTIVTACAEHIEAERPIGATVTVVSVTEVEIPIVAKIKLVNGHSLDEVKADLSAAVSALLAALPFAEEQSVPYSRFLASLLQCAGVADYSTFTVNGAKTALRINSGTIPVLGTVDVRIQGCFPATAQCGVLDLGAIGDVLWTLYQQQEIKSLVPEYAQEAARRANTMQLQRCDAAGISPAVHDHYPEQSLWPSFEMEPCEENAAASLQYVPPLIQFPSKTRFYARLWRTPFHGLVGQSRLLSALLEESRQSQVKHRSAYIYTRLCSLVSGFCNKVSRKIVSKLYRLKSKIAS